MLLNICIFYLNIAKNEDHNIATIIHIYNPKVIIKVFAL